MTASSPWIEGMMETRKSMVRPLTRRRNRPSWGTRFSAMSSSDITLMRLMIVSWCRLSRGSTAGYKTPSIRYLTRTSRSFVSIWTSEARRSMAPRTRESTRRTMGLSGDAESRSISSSSSATSRKRRDSLACSRRISPPRCRFSTCATRSSGATTASMGRPRRHSTSSTRAISSRPPKARTRRPRAWPTGMQENRAIRSRGTSCQREMSSEKVSRSSKARPRLAARSRSREEPTSPGRSGARGAEGRGSVGAPGIARGSYHVSPGHRRPRPARPPPGWSR